MMHYLGMMVMFFKFLHRNCPCSLVPESTEWDHSFFYSNKKACCFASLSQNGRYLHVKDTFIFFPYTYYSKTPTSPQKYWLRDPDQMFSAVFEPGLPSVNTPYLEMSGVRKAHTIRPHSLKLQQGRGGEEMGGGGFWFCSAWWKVPLNLTFHTHSCT